ncbi:hypothetical protein BLNAU_12489 [Blattamonas nauphoetae]|uniref:Uncharacterized protein n=1 Tax=Blattamonas nauphoetae TaxID=2049346 RepID=A0ABQ9XNZ9_9EUKA|nr:hypothetical protein BLNAU_12489 [Blattamonas nauphoetae]
MSFLYNDAFASDVQINTISLDSDSDESLQHEPETIDESEEEWEFQQLRRAGVLDFISTTIRKSLEHQNEEQTARQQEEQSRTELSHSLSSTRQTIETTKEWYSDLKEFQDYLNALTNCLDTKVPTVEQCEEEYFQLKRSLIKQKQVDLSASHTLSNPDPFINELFTLYSQTRGIASSQTNWAIDDDQSSPNLPLNVIEMKMENIISTLTNLFADTKESFSSIRGILPTFIRFFNEHPASFEEFSVEQHLLIFLAPFVRKEIIEKRWSVYSDPQFGGLFDWILDLGDDEDFDGNDSHNLFPSSFLISTLIEKILVPIACDELMVSFDISDDKHISSVLLFLEELDLFTQSDDGVPNQSTEQVRQALRERVQSIT